jgi:hypothetical protein
MYFERDITYKGGEPYNLSILGNVQYDSPLYPHVADTAILGKNSDDTYAVLPVDSMKKSAGELKIQRANVCIAGLCTFDQFRVQTDNIKLSIEVRALYPSRSGYGT